MTTNAAHEAADRLLSGESAPSASFDIGTVVRGVIVDKATSQRRDLKVTKDGFEQGDLKWWDEAHTQPKMQVVITLQTDFRNWEATPETQDKSGEDDGMRRLFIFGRSKKSPDSTLDATKAALRAAKAKILDIGGVLEMECFGEHKPLRKNVNPAKRYRGVYEAPDPEMDDDDDDIL
jgi:hypothetical protein